MKSNSNVSLVIPVFNEKDSIIALLTTIRAQTFQPAEILLVDGGSTDDTPGIIRSFINDDNRFILINAGPAFPGKGRNIGVEKATEKWIAFTDAGIKLDTRWLEYMVNKTIECPDAGIIYGNYAPEINSFFDKCACITYVPAAKKGLIRAKSVASCMMLKEVWQKAGGFPEWRATEDLVFMEKAGRLGYPVAEAPEAIVFWKLRQGLLSTFQKFVLYSKYNVWAGRQAFWHYGIARQYLLVPLSIFLAIYFNVYWLLVIPVWLSARIVKRMIPHRFEFGNSMLFNPAIFFTVVLLTLVIDAATFTGWIWALVKRRRI